jgi:hypothetical protein
MTVIARQPGPTSAATVAVRDTVDPRPEWIAPMRERQARDRALHPKLKENS